MTALIAAAVSVLVGVAAPGSHAASGPPTARSGAGLHVTGKAVRLGKSVSIVAEAPDGAAYFASGTKVYVVRGGRTPLFHSDRRLVLALAATNGDVFVQTGLTVAEYTARSRFVRQWKLSSPVKPVTNAGLVVSGRTVWSWTYSATRSNGFASTVSEISTASFGVRVVSKDDAFPYEMAADNAGLYYLIFDARSGKDYLVLTAPSGVTTHRVVTSAVAVPIALSPGRVDLLAITGGQSARVVSHRASNLASLGSKVINGGGFSMAGTTAGLLVMQCGNSHCTKPRIAVVNPATGAISRSISVPGGGALLPGPAPAALTYAGGVTYLVRLAG